MQFFACRTQFYINMIGGRGVKRISFESNFACENEIRFLKVPAEFRSEKKNKKNKNKISIF